MDFVMNGKFREKQGYQTRIIVLAIVLGFLAALSTSLTLGSYDLSESFKMELSTQSGVFFWVLSKLAALVWRFGQSLTHMSFQQSLLVVVAAYGFMRILPFAKSEDIKWMVPLSVFGGIAIVFAESFYRANSWELVLGGVSCMIIAVLKATGTASLFLQR